MTLPAFTAVPMTPLSLAGVGLLALLLAGGWRLGRKRVPARAGRQPIPSSAGSGGDP